MFAPETEDILSSVDIPIKGSPTVRTDPVSYSKHCDAFRSRSAAQRAARRASLSAIPFIDLDILAAQRNRFVVQHLSKSRPASVKNGLSHSCFSQLTGIDVTNDDSPIGLDKSRGLFVKKIFSRIGNLGVNSLNSLFVSGSLCLAKRLFVFPEYSWVFNFRTIRHRGECFKTKVNSDLSECSDVFASNLASEIDIPTTTGVLRKRAALEFPFYVSAFPEPENSLFITYRSIGYLNGACDERQPTERFFPSMARTFMGFVAGLHKLATNCGNSIAVKPKPLGTSCRKFYEVKSCRPPFFQSSRNVMSLNASLDANALIPNEVTCLRVAQEIFCTFVLDSIFVSQYHIPMLIGLIGEVK